MIKEVDVKKCILQELSLNLFCFLDDLFLVTKFNTVSAWFFFTTKSIKLKHEGHQRQTASVGGWKHYSATS